MKNHLLLALLFLSSMGARAGMFVSVVNAPATTDGYFTATVVGGPDGAQRNPCYGVEDCTFRFYTIDEGWLPGGWGGYSTYDTGFSSPFPANRYPTLAEWWSTVTDKNRVGRDSLPQYAGEKPCVVVAAGRGDSGMYSGTIVSNCAKGIVQAKSCEVKPNNINVDLHAVIGGAAPTVDVNNVTLTCTGDASVLIETNSGERIPLGGPRPPMRSSTGAQDMGNPKPSRRAATSLRNSRCVYKGWVSICLVPVNLWAAR
ncbi:Uncharacterised protein [Serratia plymuthica]|uniref:Secreted protein n=1 Tax=Serratia plymuthica TaxID=82996 RepID=A0A2X4U3F4_SERPL|nr:Uncharacterised protein [Serratia plymuthica]